MLLQEYIISTIKHNISNYKRKISTMNAIYFEPIPYEPFYNFEHEDIAFPALINEEMINTLFHLASECLPYLPLLVKILMISSVAFYISSECIKILTPGYQILEFVYIVSCLFAACSLAYLATKIIKDLDNNLTKLKAEHKELNEKNQELKEQLEDIEKENEEMKNTFRIMMTYADPSVMQRKRVKQIKN